MERKGIITVKGAPLTLIGPALRPGDKAPGFTVLDGDLKEVRLGDFQGKIKAVSVTPSLDTPVCDLQARRFNQEAAGLPEDMVVLNISMDLPFAITRFCTQAGIDRVKALSDHRDASFGTAYGVLIKELRLLARSIFIVDKADVIRYAEIVPDITEHPDYGAAVKVLHGMLPLPGIPDKEYLSITDGLDAEGFLLNFSDWDEKTAVALAAREGLGGLTQEHIGILTFIREQYRKYNSFPVLSALCRNIHQPHNCMREDFMTPSQAWKLAGLPKPDKVVAATLERGETPT